MLCSCLHANRNAECRMQNAETICIQLCRLRSAFCILISSPTPPLFVPLRPATPRIARDRERERSRRRPRVVDRIPQSRRNGEQCAEGAAVHRGEKDVEDGGAVAETTVAPVDE